MNDDLINDLKIKINGVLGGRSFVHDGVKRFAILPGTTIYAYNSVDDAKYRQQTTHDIFFTADDVICEYDEGVYRVRLNKGNWEWFEVDLLDLCDIQLTSRRAELERRDLERKRQQERQKQLDLENEAIKAMSDEIAKEIDAEILNKLTQQLNQKSPWAPATSVTTTISSGSFISNISIGGVNGTGPAVNNTVVDYEKMIDQIKKYEWTKW
jgi:hypothetical protein